MKKYLLAILLTGIAANIYSQNTFKGTVKDHNTNEGIPFASVYFPDLEKGGETNEYGAFNISNLPATGSYKIVVSSIGYTTYSHTVNLSNIHDLQILLKATAVEIEEVIVSTPFHKLQSENVMKVERAGLKELRTKGSLTLSDGITNLAGVESVSTGVGIGKPVIRGLSSNRVLVYSQGIRLENQQFGSEHGLGVNDAGIESVEVIKGPASLLYGSDAMGGVLYLNPEKYADSGETEGDVNFNYFGNTSGLSSNAGIRSSINKLKVLARGSYTSHQDYQTGQGDRVTNSRFNEYDLKTGLGYQNDSFKSDVRYNYIHSELGIPEEIGIQSSDRTPMEPFQELNTHIISARNNIFFGKSTLDLTLGYIMNERKEFEEHDHGAIVPGLEEEEDEMPALHMKLGTFSYNALYHLPAMGDLITIVGVQGMMQTNKNFGEELLIPDATTNDIGVLATSHYHFNEKADLQLGIRFDNRGISTEEHGVSGDEGYFEALNRNFSSFNFAAGIKLDLHQNLTSRINFATGFRAPNLAELTSNGAHEGTNRYEIGNAGLHNESNYQADLSIEYRNEHLEFFANGFYNHVNDYIFLSPDGTFVDQDPVYNYTQGNAELYGGELGFHLHPHPFDWLHLESSFETVTGKLRDGDYLPLIPANSFTNTIRVEFGNEMKKVTNSYAFITLKNVLDQNNISEFETSTAGYSLLSAGLGGEISLFSLPIDLKISANNLLNKTYVSHLSRLKADNIPNIGRSINAGLSIRI